MSYIVETFNLTKRFPQVKSYREMFIHPFRKKETTALESVSIKVRRGELFGILGPNGAGKTTLIKLLCTLILPNEGTAYINGYNVVEESEKVKASIGLITGEERSFYWRLTGKQNLQFFASLYNLSSYDAQERINRVLKLVDLQDKADDRFQSYSTGMKQRMAIARGLINDPEVLFMDEPTKGLDPIITQEIREFIAETIVKEQGKTVFLATNNMQEAEQLCDRIAIINQGKVKAYGTLGDLQEIMSPKLIMMKVKNISSNTLNRIGRLEGVISFDSSIKSPITTLKIRASSNGTVLPQIIDIIVGRGGKIMDCNTSVKGLDDVFIKLTGEDYNV
jgi:ABC-2 type transport system ATP-binding protein